MYETTTEIDETASTETTFKYPNSGIIAPFRNGFQPIFTEEPNSKISKSTQDEEVEHILHNTTTEIMVETTETIYPNTNPGEPDDNVQETPTDLEIQTTENILETSTITIEDIFDTTTTTNSLEEEEEISIASTTTDFLEIMEY